MTTDTFLPGEYANNMSEIVENLIVKAGKMLPEGSQISG